jgi:hypothetical protein
MARMVKRGLWIREALPLAGIESVFLLGIVPTAFIVEAYLLRTRPLRA